MENLNWECSPDMISNEFEESIIADHSSSFGYNNMNLPQDHTFNILHKTTDEQPQLFTFSNSHHKLSSSQMFQPLAPSPMTNGLMPDFGVPVGDHQPPPPPRYVNNGFQHVKAPETCTASASASLESIECLLSGANSNNDTSVEDDGINSIVSHKNLWNFGAISQCSSDNLKRNCTKRGKDHCQNLRQDSFPNLKKARVEKLPSSSNINFRQPSDSCVSTSNWVEESDSEAIAQMKAMIYRAAVFRPVNLGEDMNEVVQKPRRKNVRISSDPQTVAARQRRERISEKIRVLQRLVPGGSKMDTASMLDEAANYLKFLRSQIKAFQSLGHHKKLDFVNCPITATTTTCTTTTNYPFPDSLLLPLHHSSSNSHFFP